MKENPQVGIVLGSDSDLPLMDEALKVLDDFEVAWELTVASAHRAPLRVLKYAQEAEKRGLEVIIAGAGMAAHLPGVIASHTCLPVIGVPVQGGALGGQDALYSIVQMPPGVPVAAVAINGARNAALLAVQILAIKDADLRERFRAYKERLAAEVAAKDETVQKKLAER